MTAIEERVQVDGAHRNAQASVGRRSSPGTSKVIIVEVRESEEECDADHQRIVVNGIPYESYLTMAELFERHRSAAHHHGDWRGWTESEIRALLESCKIYRVEDETAEFGEENT
jgi:hypothetical protein